MVEMMKKLQPLHWRKHSPSTERADGGGGGTNQHTTVLRKHMIWALAAVVLGTVVVVAVVVAVVLTNNTPSTGVVNPPPVPPPTLTPAPPTAVPMVVPTPVSTNPPSTVAPTPVPMGSPPTVVPVVAPTPVSTNSPSTDAPTPVPTGSPPTDSVALSENSKLTASDGAANDQFGFDVAIAGDTIVVGSWRDDDNGADSGSAYVFTRTETTWTEQAKLTASNGIAGGLFGISVAIAGDTIVVGADGDGDNGSDFGSASVFTRTGTIWTQQAKLIASDGAELDGFGFSVAIAGDTIVVGAYW